MNLYLEHPHPCSYLPEEICQNLTFDLLIENESVTEELLATGFRHFGTHWFIPACPECSKCQGIYIDVNRFEPSKSLRKVWNKNRDLRIERSEPSASVEKVDLLNRYQLAQSETLGWNLQVHTLWEYECSFVKGNPFCEEYRIYDDSKLIGVGLMDCAGNRASSIYFYCDPEYRNRSLGTWSVLAEIEECRSRRIEFLHLGLWNSECRSLAYKNRFGSCILLPEPNIDSHIENLTRIFS